MKEIAIGVFCGLALFAGLISLLVIFGAAIAAAVDAIERRRK